MDIRYIAGIVFIAAIAGASGGIGLMGLIKYAQCDRSTNCTFEQIKAVFSSTTSPNTPIDSVLTSPTECLTKESSEDIWKGIYAFVGEQPGADRFSSAWNDLSGGCAKPDDIIKMTCKSLEPPGGFFGVDCANL